jgi:hypothetical protein
MERAGLINKGSTEGVRTERATAMPSRSAPAEASVPDTDGRSARGTPALRAGESAARALSEPAGVSEGDRAVPGLSRRTVVLTLILLVAAGAVGTFLAFNSSPTTGPRTEVLRSEGPFPDIWIRITGPGGAVSYIGHRFLTGGDFSRFTLHKEPTKGLFLPPPVHQQKLCGATHLIQPGDAPQLQRWQGKKLAITIYGRKDSAIYCAVLGYGLYLG